MQSAWLPTHRAFAQQGKRQYDRIFRHPPPAMACRHNIARGVDAGHDLSRNQPVAKSRITQRSFTYIMSRPCAQARAPVNVTCSTLSSILVNFPGLMTVSSRSINAIAAPDSNYPENTIFLHAQ